MSTDTDPTIAHGAPVGDAPPEAPADETPAPPGPTGNTWIADSIVAKVAASAAREVEGVEDLRTAKPRRGWVRAAERRRGGASVRVEAGSAAVEVRLVVRDGVAIPRIVDEVRARVIDRVEFATGLSVTNVNVGVVDVVPAAPVPDAAAQDPALEARSEPDAAPAGAPG